MFFDQYLNNKNFIHEAEDDEDDYNISDDDNNNDNQDQNNIENNDDNNDLDSKDTNDYNINDNPDINNNPNDNNLDDTNNTDDEDDYNINDNQDQNNIENNDPRNRLKELEKSIFDQLSKEQQEAKIKELKELYNISYLKCQEIIDLINNTQKTPDQANTYDYIVARLNDLKKYITDYLTNIFDSKTYFENMIEFQKYLAIFDTIKNIFNDIKIELNSDN